MKNGISFLIIAMAFPFISCETVKYKTRTTVSSAKSMNVYGPGVIQNPVIVDLDVNDVKVSGTAFEYSIYSLDNLKNLAVADAIKNANADILVEPMFEIVIVDDKTTVTVSGFPAHYKNFRPLKKEDLQIIDAGISSKVRVYEPIKTENVGDTTHLKKKEIKPKSKNKSQKLFNIIIGTGIIMIAVILASSLSGI